MEFIPRWGSPQIGFIHRMCSLTDGGSPTGWVHPQIGFTHRMGFNHKWVHHRIGLSIYGIHLQMGFTHYGVHHRWDLPTGWGSPSDGVHLQNKIHPQNVIYPQNGFTHNGVHGAPIGRSLCSLERKLRYRGEAWILHTVKVQQENR